MKKLLSLICIITLFYSCNDESTNYDCTPFGCSEMPNGPWSSLEDCESMCHCSCGQVVDVVIFPEDDGVSSIDPITGDTIIEHAHDSYVLSYVENYCSKNVRTTCEILTVGESHCMEYPSTYEWNISGIDSITFLPVEVFDCYIDNNIFQ